MQFIPIQIKRFFVTLVVILVSVSGFATVNVETTTPIVNCYSTSEQIGSMGFVVPNDMDFESAGTLTDGNYIYIKTQIPNGKRITGEIESQGWKNLDALSHGGVSWSDGDVQVFTNLASPHCSSNHGPALALNANNTITQPYYHENQPCVGFEFFGNHRDEGSRIKRGLAGLSALPLDADNAFQHALTMPLKTSTAKAGNAPNNLTATVLNASSVEVDWEIPDTGTPDAYQVWTATVTETPFGDRVDLETLLGETTDTTYIVGGLQANTEYTFAVVGITGGVQSSVSNSVTVTTAKAGNAPNNLTATVLNASSVELDWDIPDTGTPDSYQIWTATVSSTPFGDRVDLDTLLGETANTSYVVGGLQANTEYTFAGVGITGGVQSSVSNSVTVTTPSDTSDSTIPDMVLIPSGTFQMGSPDGEGLAEEKPQHLVSINQFYIGKYEVTFEQYDAFCEATGRAKPSDSGWGRGDRPVINVSYGDAIAYCDWLTANNQGTYYLPSEPEWEYACRAGTSSTFNVGNNISTADANFNSDVGKTAEVGSYPANNFGLYDMHGNVWEWCEDWKSTTAYSNTNLYTQNASGNPVYSITTSGKVVRGGGWNSNADGCRSAYRNGTHTYTSNISGGFRVAGTYSGITPNALNIPHIATSWGWGTKLIIDNSDPETRDVTISIYKSGALLSEETHSVSANSSLAMPVADGDCGFVTHTGTNVSVRVSYIHTEEDGIAEFQLSDLNYNQLTYTMPQYLAGKLTWMGLAVMNPTDQETQVQFTAIGSDGTALGTASVDLPAYTRKASVLSSLFESVPFSSIAQVIAQSDRPICGINISGIENRQLLFTQATGTDPQPRTLHLPHIATNFSFWTNNLVFDNTGDIDTTASVTLYTEGSVAVRNLQVFVPAHNATTLNLNDYADMNVDSGVVKCYSDGLHVRIAYVNDVNGTAEFELNGTASPETILTFPSYTADILTWMGMAVFNPGTESTTATLVAYKAGEQVGTASVFVPAQSRVADVLDNIFDPFPEEGIDMIRISSSEPLAGINISGSGQERLLFTKGTAARYETTANTISIPGATFIVDGVESQDEGTIPTDEIGAIVYNDKAYLVFNDGDMDVVLTEETSNRAVAQYILNRMVGGGLSKYKVPGTKASYQWNLATGIGVNALGNNQYEFTNLAHRWAAVTTPSEKTFLSPRTLVNTNLVALLGDFTGQFDIQDTDEITYEQPVRTFGSTILTKIFPPTSLATFFSSQTYGPYLEQDPTTVAQVNSIELLDLTVELLKKIVQVADPTSCAQGFLDASFDAMEALGTDLLLNDSEETTEAWTSTTLDALQATGDCAASAATGGGYGVVQEIMDVVGSLAFVGQVGVGTWDSTKYAPYAEFHIDQTPSIQLSTSSISVSCTEGENVSDRTFTVTNSGTGTLNYSISDNVTWLTCSPSSGNSTGETDTITIDFTTSNLSADTYNATITVSDGNATNSPQTIAVTLTVNSSGGTIPDMVLIPSGTFQMGSPDGEGLAEEKPQHLVSINQFYIGKYEVTFEQYDAFCEATGRAKPSDSGWGRGYRPVINVSYGDTIAYCDWLTANNQGTYYLPSEPEWEYACRAGTTSTFNVGNNLSTGDANFNSDVGKTAEVGSYPANDFGLYDMHGNVWEWCEDWKSTIAYSNTNLYTQNASGNPVYSITTSGKVVRGGGWNSNADGCRSAYRNGTNTSTANISGGFRVARTY